MFPSPTEEARKDGWYSGASAGSFCAAIVVAAVLLVAVWIRESHLPVGAPEQCAPFVHVAAFKDGDKTRQVCRTLDGGLEMK